jgi:UDP-glucose 4-epimerase
VTPAPSARRVLVTGGSGFIGTQVVRALLAAGDDVTVADLREPSLEVPAVIGDLTQPGGVDAALQPGTDAIVHLAAVTSVLGSVQRPVETFETNVAMTAALLERARTIGVPAVVFASTNAAVGGGAAGGVIDERSTLQPLTPYGATKAAAEMLLSASTSSFGVRGVALRLTNVYGTGMALKDSVVARIMRAAESGSVFEVYGDGHQVRDYVFADDVVRAVLLALSSDFSGPMVVGSGTSTSVLDLLDLAREATGRPLDARHVASKPGEMSGVVVDNAHARALGWAPQVDVASGLAKVWAAWNPGPG